MTKEICQFLEDMKAQDVLTIDVTGKSTIADHLIIATGRSVIHNRTLARSLMSGEVDINITYNEGMDTCEWIVLSGDSILIHIMTPEAREYYHLEDLWDVDI